MKKNLPSLTEEVEKMVTPVINVAGAEAMKNSEANKEAADKANEEAQKVADEFTKEEDKMVDKAEKESLKEDLHESDDQNYVTNKEFYRAYSKLQEECYERFGKYIQLTDFPMYTSDDPVEIGVNWSARGLVKASDAEKFGHDLAEAAKMAREFPYNGMKIKWEEYEALNEASDEDDEYPETFLGGETHFKRANLTGMDRFTVTYPSFTIEYEVQKGIQTKPGDPEERGHRDTLGKLEIVDGDIERAEKMFENVLQQALVSKGFDKTYIGGGTYLSVPNYVDLYTKKANESLNEEVEESTFDKLYKEIILTDGVEGNRHTHFAKDDKSVDIIIDIDETVDLDNIYDIIDKYQDAISVDEDDERIKIHMDFPDTAAEATDIYPDLYDEIMKQLTMSGTLIPGPEGGKGWRVNRGAGYNARTQISNAEDGSSISVRVVEGGESEDSEGGYVDSLEPAIEIAEKYADLGVTTSQRYEIEKTLPHKVAQVLTIRIPLGAKAADRDERMWKRKKSKPTEVEDVEEGLRTKEDPWGLLK